MNEEREVRVPKIRIEVNGAKWDFQEFCEHLARNFEFLGNRSGYVLRKYSEVEGMETHWRLMEKKLTGEIPLGPTLIFSNVRGGWTSCNPYGEFEIKYIEVGADPLLSKQITLASI